MKIILRIMKRIFDIFFSLFGLLILSPFYIFILFLVWKNDKHNPFYVGYRVGLHGKLFKMIKIRTMVINADANGVDSTSENDTRITKIGSFIRKYKFDEIPQLFNILLGQMSFVGPRPSVKRDTDLYTKEELKLLSIKPGITDFASIVFSDESNILANSKDPDISYHQLIRPGKNKLALFYLKRSNVLIDLLIIIITLLAILSRKYALMFVCILLKNIGASKELIDIASRKYKLVPKAPPGSDMITKTRNI